MAAEAGRLRTLLQQAQALVAELKQLPLDQDTTRAAYPRVFELCRLVNRFNTVSAALPSGDPAQDAVRASWLQRAQWLQEDTISLAQERVWSADSKELCSNLLLLLCAGADACDKALREKAEREVLLAAAQQQVNQLQAQVVQLHAAQEQQGVVAQQALEARSQLAVLQQQLAASSSVHQQLQAQLQEAATTIQRLETELQSARAEVQEARELAESRVQVIQMLMERAESNLGDRQQASQLQADFTAMQASLQANAAVVEKLIELNTELMEQHNAAQRKSLVDQPPMMVVVDGAAEPNSSTPDVWPRPAAGWPPSSTYGTAPQSLPGPAGGPGPPVARPGAAAEPAVAAVAAAAAVAPPPAEPSSLADAFAAFLK